MTIRLVIAALLVASSPAIAVYKCEAPGKPATYQDIPCLASERMTRLDAANASTPAGAAAVEADKATIALAKQKADRLAALAAKEAKEKEERAKAVAGGMASYREWQEAKYAVHVGMTQAQLVALHRRFEFGGRRRTMESPAGTDEWIDFDEDHLTIRIHNGVVAFIHR